MQRDRSDCLTVHVVIKCDGTDITCVIGLKVEYYTRVVVCRFDEHIVASMICRGGARAPGVCGAVMHEKGGVISQSSLPQPISTHICVVQIVLERTGMRGGVVLRFGFIRVEHENLANPVYQPRIASFVGDNRWVARDRLPCLVHRTSVRPTTVYPGEVGLITMACSLANTMNHLRVRFWAKQCISFCACRQRGVANGTRPAVRHVPRPLWAARLAQAHAGPFLFGTVSL